MVALLGLTVTRLFALNISNKIIFVENVSQENRKEIATETSSVYASTLQVYNSGSIRLLEEIERQMTVMKTSEYAHRTQVDENEGIFIYDCSGLINYALQRSLPQAWQQLLNYTNNKRPRAKHYYEIVTQHDQSSESESGWQRIERVIDLSPGDIVVWLKPAEVQSKVTGHIMVVAGDVSVNPVRPKEQLIPVIDSTKSPHGRRDSRYPDNNGLGKGTIGLVVDETGEPYGYYWRGGESTKLFQTEIALIRLGS